MFAVQGGFTLAIPAVQPQPHPPFVHAVSVLDLLLSVGEDASRYLKTFSAVT